MLDTVLATSHIADYNPDKEQLKGAGVTWQVV